MSQRCIAVTQIPYVPKMIMHHLQYIMSKRKLKILRLQLLKSSCQQQEEEEAEEEEEV